MTNSLLTVEGLTTSFLQTAQEVDAVRNISFSIQEGESVGLVGESGCGKSVTSLSILRLLPKNARISSGRIMFSGQDLLALDHQSLRKIRGNQVSMIFQEPMTSLNPVYTIGDQVAEVLQIHRGLSRKAAMQRAEELLALVRIAEPKRRLCEYPHQLSGGMRQRVMIAIALACEPKLLIADEPTTALDVTIQAQILELLRQLREDIGMAVLLITHDLGVVAEFCDRVMVMYAGRIVESATVGDLFRQPQHPYTRGLLNAAPRLGRVKDRLPTIEGTVPSLGSLPVGCSFQNRCIEAVGFCQVADPLLKKLSGANIQVACHVRHGEVS